MTQFSDNQSQNDHSHASLMDRIYKFQRHIYDFTRKYYLLGRDRLIDDLRPQSGETVLEVGCGTGRNLIAAARKYPWARFYGFDISDAMLQTARENVAKCGFSDRITLVRGDASSFSAEALFDVANFDRVFFSYTLSMIPSWEAAITQGMNALAPQGSLHIVDFGQQEKLPMIFRKLLTGWLALFHVEPRAGLNGVVDDIAHNAGFRRQFNQLYGGYAWGYKIMAFPQGAPCPKS